MLKIDRKKVFILFAILLFAICAMFLIYFFGFMEENIEAALGGGSAGGEAVIKFNFDGLKSLGL